MGGSTRSLVPARAGSYSLAKSARATYAAATTPAATASGGNDLAAGAGGERSAFGGVALRASGAVGERNEGRSIVVGGVRRSRASLLCPGGFARLRAARVDFFRLEQDCSALFRGRRARDRGLLREKMDTERCAPRLETADGPFGRRKVAELLEKTRAHL